MKKAPEKSSTKTEDKATKPSPEAQQRAARKIFLFGGLLLLTLLIQSLELPWRMLAVLTGGAAAVFGVLALIATWKSGMRGLTIPAVVVGTVMSILMAFSTLLAVFIWDIEMDLQDCKNGAITVSATEQCDATYKSEFEQWRQDLESKAGLGN